MLQSQSALTTLDTGYDVKFFGATTGKSLLWDESADSLIVTGTTTLVGTTNLDAVDIDGATQIDATVTVGVDDTGYDVKFFGATAGAYMLWDESADDLILGGAAGLSVNSTALVTGVLTTTAATVSNGGGQFNGAINVGVDDTGYDVKFFGATTGKSLLWDESADSLTVAGNLSVDGGTIKLDGNYPVGTGNVALGDAALDSVEAGGSYNVAIGDSAGTAITTGDHNVAIGFNALDAEDGGTASVAIGSYALSSQNADGNNFNTAVGYVAGSDITTGIQNTLIGALAGDALIAAADNVAVGFEALSTETGGQNNVAIGPRALKVQVNASGNIYNTAVGSNAATATTTGNLNTAIGGNALYSNTTASNNTAVGYQAGYANTTGIQNLFVGSDAGYANTTGSGNTYVGRGDSVAAGVLMTTGSKNTILGGFTGSGGGLDIRTSSNNIVLSDGDGNPRVHVDSGGDVILGPQVGNKTLSVQGHVFFETGPFYHTASDQTVGYINRLASDGGLINFYHDTVVEGSITVSGTTVSYNGGHLARWSQTTDNTRIDLVKGTVMTNLDQMAVWGDEDNEQLNCMAVSSVEGDPNVAGVFVNWDNDDETYTADMNIAMTGDMIIRIAQGTTVQRGDLLMSAGDGTAKPQGDDIVRSKTIAKVTSTHVTCTYDDGSYCVPCVLMAC
jgi:hypothetical protein